MADRLHRIHAAPAAGKGGCSVDIGQNRWRPEGGKDRDEKRAAARRIAVCWNVLEGWPTDALESGALLEVDEAALALLDELDHVDLERVAVDRSPGICEAMKRLRAAFAKRDALIDLTNGRKHDCESCAAHEGSEAP
jgi:hypothetical protein